MINRLQMPQRAELVALKMGQYRTLTTPTNREETTNQKIEKKDTVEINSTKENKEQRTTFYSPKMFEITVTTFKTLDFFMKASLNGRFNGLNGVYTSKLSVQGVFQSTTKTTTDTTSKEIEETDGSDSGTDTGETGKPPISDGDHTEKPEGGSNPSHGGGCCCCCCCHPSSGNNGSGGMKPPDKIEPVKPIEPVSPVEPEVPPIEPVIPAEPEIPIEPVVPVIPTQPIIPVEPEFPEPVIPVEPAKPVEPVKPTEPEVDKDIDKDIDDSIKDSEKHPSFFLWLMDLIKKYGKFKDELDKKVGNHILTPKESLEIIKKNKEFILTSIKERYPSIDIDIFKNSFK